MEHKTKHKLFLKEFFKFLKNTQLLETYVKNVDCEKAKQFRRRYEFQISATDFMIDILKKNPRYLILYAFDWASADEGYDFWEFASMKWCNYFNEIRYMRKIIKEF